jgi:sugar (pentulose or hexulose) kinase
LPDDGAAQPFAGQIGDDGKTVFPAIGDEAAGNLGSGATWSGLVAIMSARGRPGCRHLTMLLSWVGELAPTWPENLTGTVVGLSQATTAADLWRAAFSAVSFRLAEIFEQLEGALGRPKKIVLSDGILQSPALLRFVTARS